jgi:hypothetical protein
MKRRVPSTHQDEHPLAPWLTVWNNLHNEIDRWFGEFHGCSRVGILAGRISASGDIERDDTY